MDNDVNVPPPPETLLQARQAQWLSENRAAIEEYNAYVERNGLTLSEFRTL